MPIYKNKGVTYNIPDDKAAGFEAKFPGAMVALENEGVKYELPVSKKKGFMEKFPGATYSVAAPPAPKAEDINPTSDKSGYTLTAEELGIEEPAQAPTPMAKRKPLVVPVVDNELPSEDHLGELGLSTDYQMLARERRAIHKKLKKGEITPDDARKAEAEALHSYEATKKADAAEAKRREELGLWGRLGEDLAEVPDVVVENVSKPAVIGLGVAGAGVELLTGYDGISKVAVDELQRIEDSNRTDVVQAFEEVGAGVVNLAGYAGGLLGADDFQKSVTEMTDRWVGNNNPDKMFLASLTPTIAGSLLTIGAGLVGGPGAATVVGNTWLGVQIASGAGNSMREAEKYGATEGEMWLTGGLNAVAEYVTEKIPLKRLLGKVPVKLTGAAGKIDDVMLDAETKKLREAIQASTGINLKEITATALEEGGTEALAEVAQTAIETLYKNPEDYPTLTQYTDAAIDGFLSGALVGGVTGGTQDAVQRSADNKRREAAGKVTFAMGKDEKGKGVAGELVGKDEKGRTIMEVAGRYIPVTEVGKGITMTYEQFRNAEFENMIAQKFEEGYNVADEQKGAVKQVYDMERERALSVLGEEVVQRLDDDPIGTLAAMNDIDRHEATGYVNAKTAYEGMIDRISDDIDERIAASDKEIDSHKNRQDGAIHPAMMRGVNGAAPKRVYIVSGNVATFEDGTIDKAKSSDFILVRDAETGEVKAASVDEFDTIDEVIDTATEKKSVADAIANQVATEKAAVIENGEVKAENGKLTYNSNDGVHTVEILGENGDVFTILDNGVERIATREWVDELKAQNGVVSPVEENAPAVEQTQPVAQTQPAPIAQVPKTALEQIPRNENNIPQYEQVDSELAWDGVVEEAGGNEETAMVAVNSMVEDKKKALAAAEKAKAKAGATITEKIAAENERVANIEKAKADLAKWEEIAGVKAKRAAAQAENVAQPTVETAPVVESAPVEDNTPQSQNDSSPTLVEQPTPQATNEMQEADLTEDVKAEDVNETTLSQPSEQVGDQVTEGGNAPGQSGVIDNNSANALQNGNNELNLQKENESDNESNQNDIPVGGQVSQSVSQGEHGAQASLLGGAQETAARLRERIESAQGDSKSGLREVENRVTREFAHENGLWVENEFKLGVPFPSGDEHNNYIDAENQVVYKVNNRMHTPSILDLLDRIEQHNKYFPDSKYSLVGFTSVSKNGDVMPVFAQDFVPDARMATVDEIDSYMGTLGFTRVGDGRYSNGEVVIKDLKPRNVLVDPNGDVYVVDAEFEQEKAQKGGDVKDVSEETTQAEDEAPVTSETTEHPETGDVAVSGPVNMETLQLNMSEEDFNALLNSGDKAAISEYLAEMDGLLRIGVGSPLDGQEALREEYRKAVEQYGKENIPAEVMDDLNSRMQPYSDLSRAIFDRKYALQDKLREIEASEAQAYEQADKVAKAEHKQTAFGGFLAGKTDLGASAAEKALSKKYNFDGKLMTVAEFVEEAVGNGNVKLSAIEEPKYKGASRAAWNRMDARQQEADAKRVKESGTKTVYTVNDHDFGKTAYDYAKFLLDKKAEQEKSSQGKRSKGKTESESKPEVEKIEDVGEVLAGARKDALKVLASSFENATVKSLIELPFSKAFKKPDLKKAVESGALREEDALFYEAMFNALINSSKPKNSARHRNAVETWAEETYNSLQLIKSFVEADEAARDRAMAEALEDKFPAREEELAVIEKRKVWNARNNAEWGDKTTPNPVWVAHEVLKALGYKPGDKVEIPFGVLKANVFATGYEFYNKKGERLIMQSVPTVEEGIENIVWLSKIKRGDADIMHPVSSFFATPTKRDMGDSGRYYVLWGTVRNPRRSEFGSIEEANAFAAGHKEAVVRPIQEVAKRYGYKLIFREPITGDKFFVNDMEFETEGEAMQYIEDNYDAVNEQTNELLSKERGEAKKEVSADDLLEVAMVRGKEGWKYAVNIKGKYANNMGMPLLLREFDTREDAKAFLNESKNEVFEIYKKQQAEQKKFVFFDTGENSRIGEDYRGGRDVTAKDFMDTFGFRGVQFGNWTNQEDRQMAVNQAFDAFMDLAKLLGVSPKALSLNGELGMAFGSRGSGFGNAHYEPGEIVINLTKTRGAGSLAHEWWHALDNYFARRANVPMGMVTDSRSIDMRPELRQAYNELLKMIEKSDFYKRSKAKGDYWGRMHEVTARLMAEWVDQSLKDRGELNTFLSRGVNEERYKRMNYDVHRAVALIKGKEALSYEEFEKTPEALAGFPYPSRAELKEFGDAMRNIFETVEEQETEEGDVVLYRSSEDEDIPRLDKHRVEKIFGGIWIEDKEEFAKFVSAVNNYAFEENGQGIAYTDSNFYAYYLNIDGQVIPYASVKLTAEQSQEVVNQVNQEIENVREGERVKKYIDTGLERAWSIQDKDNAQPLNNSGASNRRRNGGVVSDLLRKGRYFDNPGLYVKAQRADRFGFLTPSQIERTGNGEVANSARQRRRMTEKARQVAEKLNLNNVEVLESTEGLTGKKATSKGWFDPRTGKITVVVPNHGSTGDITETVLHEAVAHYGLRKLFDKNFNNFLDNVFNNVTPEIRAEITELAKKHGWDFHTATEEYLASLAENTNFERVNPSVWSNIKSFFMKMLAKVGITLDEPLSDNELRYILWRSHQNLVNPGWFNVFGQAEDIAKQYELGVGNYASEKVETENGGVAAEDDSVLLHREGGAPGSTQATDEPMSFDEIKTAPLTFEEKITQGVLTVSALNKKNLDLRQQALREFGRDLTRLLTLMKEQRAYDKSTVDLLVKLSRLYFENAQVLDKMSAYNVKRIMGVLNNAIGKRDITDDANRLLGILMDAHTKELNNLLDTFVKTRATKMNTAGVEIIGSLDKHGQMVLATYKAAVEYDANKIDAELLKAENELTDENKVVHEEAASRLEGLLLAKEYKDEIKSRREEIAELEKEIKDKARQAREGTLDRSAYREFKRATHEAITRSNLELIGAYHALIQKMSTGIGAASARAREFMKKQLEHVQEIQHDANSDMEGKSADTQGEIPDNWNNSIARIVMGPMVTFQGILKKLGEKSVDGKGYLYNRFMKQITNAGHRLWKKKVGNLLSLNGKLSEIFGREMQYNDLYAIDKKGKGMTITYVENGGPKEIELSQGQMMYLYMINKMSDGAMKLRGMGITESAVLQIEGALMPELKTFADWVQTTFLNEKRTEYNEVHERMFGSAMANIEDYFPIKINTKSLTKEEDVALKNVEDKPSTVTGSIIKRTRNAAPVDLSANAIDVLMEHLDKMEQWAAFAETNRDLNSLLSYKRFRNQVLNLKTRRFGSGKKLWDNFRDVCALASRNYTPKTSDVDRAVTNITKGVTASKISFRLFTAMKQLLSAPAFYTETDVKELYKAYKSPKESWDWAIENLPGFAERWQSRQSGNERLKTTDADWDIWKNKYIKGAQRAGMLPNAWVDAVVVSTGARAVYLTKLKQFMAAGYEADAAEAKALQAAAEAYNESQQSSEGAYLSAMQVDRTVISTILTVFKNSNFGYTRKTAQSVANLAKHIKKGNKAQSTEFMAKQMMREGLTEEQARKYADKLWKESILRDSANVAMFGFLLNALWALGPELIYLFGGDDEEEKEKSWNNVVMGGLLSPVAGLGGGDFVSDVVTAAIDGRWENIELPGLPAFGDMENIYSLMEYDHVRGATELLNMLVSAGVGVNPKTFADMYAAIASTDFANPEELGLFVLKFVNAPQGQIDRLMVDKALENGGDNLAAVTAEYMEYKKQYNTPLLGGLYSDEGERKAYERYAKRFKRQINDRLGNVAEDDTAFAMYYEDASPELRSLLTGLREKYIEGDKEPLEPKAVADIAFETLYGKKELNTEYLKLATPDDVDALIELKQKRSELRKFKEALDALPPEQKGEFYEANADALEKYSYLDEALRGISELQKAMTLNKEAGQEILDGIRRIADAVNAEITSTENN